MRYVPNKGSLGIDLGKKSLRENNHVQRSIERERPSVDILHPLGYVSRELIPFSSSSKIIIRMLARFEK